MKKFITKEQALQIFKKEHSNFKIVSGQMKRLSWYEDVRKKREDKLERDMKRIKSLIEKGLSLREIGKELGMTYEGIRQRIIRYS